MTALRWAARRAALGEVLVSTAGYWRPQPFKIRRPAWCDRHPALTQRLLALADPDVAALSRGDSDPGALLALVGEGLPEGALLAELSRVPPCSGKPAVEGSSAWQWEVPGRKLTQIEAFAAAVDTPAAPFLEWCSGKGHLGRALSSRWRVPVNSLEIDSTLCAEGERLARRLGVPQSFVAADALAPGALRHGAGRHAVALHACGDLHRRLAMRAAATGLAALDIAPCCYHRQSESHYTPLAGPSPLHLSLDDLRLAVTGTATAGARETRRVEQETAWKLAFIALRESLTGAPYRSFRPVERGASDQGFAAWCGRLAEREALMLPSRVDWAAWEAVGWQRQRDVARLSLVRFAFRRAIEVWLAYDLAAVLEAQGYSVRVETFCDARVTPRNLLVSARRAGTGGQN